MKIIYIAGFAWEPKGTVRARAFPLAQEMAGRGHEVTMIVVPYDNAQYSGQEWKKDGVRIVHLSVPPTRSLRYARIPSRIAEIVEQIQPDVVHVFKPKGFSGMAASKLLRHGFEPLVMDCDDWEGWGGWNDEKNYPWLLKQFIDRQERALVCKSPVLTCASQMLAHRALEMGRSADDVFYLPNGITAEQIETRDSVARTPACNYKRALDLENDPVLLYAGHFDPADDVEFFCRATVQAALAFHRPVTVALAGEGEILHAAKRILRTVPNLRLRCFGQLAYPKFVQLIASADVAAFPYPDTPIYQAKCSARIIDYMLYRKAVLSTAVGENTQYIVHGRSGWLTPPGNEEGFASALRELLDDPVLRKHLGQNAGECIVQNFRWSGGLGNTCERAYRKATRLTSRNNPAAVPISA